LALRLEVAALPTLTGFGANGVMFAVTVTGPAYVNAITAPVATKITHTAATTALNHRHTLRGSRGQRALYGLVTDLILSISQFS
jgi:hypothetical protein